MNNTLKETILKAYNSRHACKEFNSDKKISAEDFDFLLEIIRLSPSSFGFEPFRIISVEDKDLRNSLKEISWGAQGQLPTASHFLLFVGYNDKKMAYNSDYIRDFMKDIQKLPDNVVEMKGNFFKDFQLNDFSLTDSEKIFQWASRQIYIYLGNLMTAASLIGIDSCAIEGFNKTKVDNLLHDRGIINKNEEGLSVMVALGYRKDEEIGKNKAKTRRETKDYFTTV